MATFPDVIGVGYSRTPHYSNTSSAFGQNNIVRYRKWVRPRYAFALSWDSLTTTETHTIEEFILSVQGAATPFYWYDWRSFFWNRIPVGIGDGATTSFDVPGKSTAGAVFYINGATQVAANVSAGAGTDGADRVTLVAPPAIGVPVTTSFFGRLRVLVTIAKDTEASFPRVLQTGLYTLALTLQQTK